MKTSIVFVPVIFIVVLITLILPRAGRIDTTPAEILPSTSLLPSAEPVVSAAASPQTVRVRSDAVARAAAAGSAITLQAGSQPASTTYLIDEFAAPLLNGNPETVVGVYVADVMALPVMQQPNDDPAFVSTEYNMLTQFSLPSRHGMTGLLAHNYLSGSLFYELQLEQMVVVVYGDGSQKQYRIQAIERYQALNPTSPYSQFVDLADAGGKVLTSGDLFNHIYTQKGKLVFQTCIDAEGDPSWGRIFIIADPVEGMQVSMPTAGQYISDN